MTSNYRSFSFETTFDSGPLAIFGQKQLEDTSEIEWEKSFEMNRCTWVGLVSKSNTLRPSFKSLIPAYLWTVT